MRTKVPGGREPRPLRVAVGSDDDGPVNRDSPVSADAGVRRRLVVVSAVAVALAAIAVSTLVVALRLTGGDDSSGRAGPGMYGVSGTHIGSMMGGRTALSEEAYLREMVAHHREAVSAAQQLARSHRPELRAFGAAVVRVQSAQIRSMRQWLRDWYPHTPLTEDYQPMMKNLTHASQAIAWTGHSFTT